MIAIILAAGKGTRLLPLSTFTPKSLVPIGKSGTILDNHLIALTTSMPCDVAVVYGHRARVMEDYIENSDFNVDLIYNPFYTNFGPLGSLWLARDRIRAEDTIIINGDTFVTQEAYQTIRANTTEKQGVWLVTSERTEVIDDDMIVVEDQSHSVIAVGKDLAREQSTLVSVGALLVKGKRHRERFVSLLDHLLRDDEGQAARWPWHTVANVAAAFGEPFSSLRIDEGEWCEIDSVSDIHRAIAISAGSVVR